MITAITCTKRTEPKFDWMADSFTRAINAVKHQVELIVVDGCLWDGETARRQKLAEAVNGRFSYRHVFPKPTNWQGSTRLTKRDYFALNNARNTGIALARGSYIVFFDDCTVLPEDFFVWHGTAAKRGIAVAGSYYTYNTAVVENGKVLSGEPHPLAEDNRGKEIQPAPGGWLWGLNMGFPLEFTLNVNGFDEMFCSQAGSDDCYHGVLLQRAGCKIWHVPQCKIIQVLETHEAIANQIGWGGEVKAKQKEIMLKDGKNHFANEKLIQDLFENPQQVWSRGNDFVLRELRKEALLTGKFPVERVVGEFTPEGKLISEPNVDWRDGQRLEDM